MQKPVLKKKTYLLALVATGGMLLSALFGAEEPVAPVAKEQTEVVSSENTQQENEVIVLDTSHWHALAVEEPNFMANFPLEAEHTSEEIAVGSDKSLCIKKYTAVKEDFTFVVAHTKLPQEWLKYGPKLVLKGALKMIAKHEGEADIAGKTENTFKGFPSLDYKHVSGDKQSAGTLILKGDTIFAVELQCDHALEHADYSAHLTSFLNGFDLPEATSGE
jgi:hypothetical protein